MMNLKTLELLEHLLDGGTVGNQGGELFTFSGFVLVHSNGSDEGSSADFSEKLLNNMEVYLDEKDIQILELKKQLIKKDKELFELKEPRRSRVGSHYKHLSIDEVREIEEIFIKNPYTSIQLICNTYNSSTSVVSRIRSGIHVKSITGFTKLFEGALNEANKSDSN